MAGGISYLGLQRSFFAYFLPFFYLLVTECLSYVVTPYYAARSDDTGVTLMGVALGLTLYNLVMVSTMFGYATIFETYGPQVYSSGNKNALGTLLLKCLLQGLLVFMVVTGPYYNIVHLVRFFVRFVHDDSNALSSDGQTVDQIASAFLRYTVGFGIIDYFVDVLNKYFVTQPGHSVIVYVGSTLYLAIYVVTCHATIVVLGLGVTGIAIAMYVSRGCNLLIHVTYCVVSYHRASATRREPRECDDSGSADEQGIAWEGITPKVFEGWGAMLYLGVSGILNMLADTGVVEFATFIALLAGPTQMSVVVVNFESYILILSFTFAHCYATSLLLGSALGSRDKAALSASLRVILSNVLLISLPIAVIIWGARDAVVRLFTENPDVIDIYTNIIWISCIFTPINYAANILTRGVLIAFGRQRFNALLSSGCSYLIGIPLLLVAVLCTDYGARGIFYVFLIFGGIKLVAAMARFYFLDFDKEIRRSEGRVKEGGEEARGSEEVIELESRGDKDDIVVAKNIHHENSGDLLSDGGAMKRICVAYICAALFMAIGVYLSFL